MQVLKIGKHSVSFPVSTLGWHKSRNTRTNTDNSLKVEHNADPGKIWVGVLQASRFLPKREVAWSENWELIPQKLRNLGQSTKRPEIPRQREQVAPETDIREEERSQSIDGL